MYEELYGLSACTENVEYSLHMPDDIVRHSTLDNYWCYLYTPHTHPLANRCAVLCFILPEYLTKVEGSNEQISNECERGVTTNR